MTEPKKRRGRPPKSDADYAEEAAFVLRVASVLRRGAFRPTKVDPKNGRVITTDWDGDIEWLQAQGFAPTATSGNDVYRAAASFVTKRRRGLVARLIGRDAIRALNGNHSAKIGTLIISSHKTTEELRDAQGLAILDSTGQPLVRVSVEESNPRAACFQPDKSDGKTKAAARLMEETGIKQYTAIKLSGVDPTTLRRSLRKREKGNR